MAFGFEMSIESRVMKLIKVKMALFFMGGKKKKREKMVQLTEPLRVSESLKINL